MTGTERDRDAHERDHRRTFGWEEERDRGRRAGGGGGGGGGPQSANYLSARSAGLPTTGNVSEGQHAQAQQAQARAIAQAQALMGGQNGGQSGAGGQIYAPFSGPAGGFRERERDREREREREMAHQAERERSGRYPPDAGAAGGPRTGGGVEARSAGAPPVGRLGESPETTRRKREEFMGLCARAWDLLHS